jgi:hypothetical protein
MLTAGDPRRILIIDGPPQSGRTVCSRFVQQAARDRRDEVLRWDAEAIQSISPEDFAERFASSIETLPDNRSNDRATSEAIPARPDDRQPARWVARALSSWVAQRVSESVAKKGSEIPLQGSERYQPSVWLIIENLDRFKLQPETHDLLRALMQTSQSTQGQALKRLKLVLVGYSGETSGGDANEITRYVTRPETVDSNAIKECLVGAYQYSGVTVDNVRIDNTVKILDGTLVKVPSVERLAILDQILRAFVATLSKSTTGLTGIAK